MTKEKEGGAPPNNGEAEERFKNLQAEFDRKLTNSTKALDDKLSMLLNSVQAAQAEKQTQAYSQEMDNLRDEDETKYRERVQQEAVEKAKVETQKLIAQQQAAQQQQAQVIGELQNQYPELQSDKHPLTQRALEIFNGLPDNDKSSSLSYKYAVQTAAQEMAMKPFEKRSVDEQDSFTLTGRGSSAAPRGSSRKGTDPKSEQFARLVGIDMDDDKNKKMLKKYSQESDWMKYKDGR